MLYLVATPIGNLSDFTFRAVETLKESDLILCEDTRTSKVLLDRYEIMTPLKSYHKFNEASREEEIIALLKRGQKISLISDAGTPAISDPGERLVAKVVTENIAVTSIPGPCSLIQALILSGFSTTPFQFIGFLSKKEGEIGSFLANALCQTATTIAFESARRLVATLTKIMRADPLRRIVIARELTKKFEELARGTPAELIQKFTEREPLGEVILVIEGGDRSTWWESLTPIEHVERIEHDFNLPKKEALKLAAELRGVPKRELYQQLMCEE
jgi:16S rRNA (cytidine1402-2'-O)-methyltransferase